MARIKLNLPEALPFSTRISIRITDLNYGNHVGNDTILSLLHEARVQYLLSHGYTELNLGGTSLIMGDVAIEYKAEAFYGDIITAYVGTADFSRVGFDIFYKLTRENAGKEIVVALAKTGMVCFDYTARKVTQVPDEVVQKLGN